MLILNVIFLLDLLYFKCFYTDTFSKEENVNVIIKLLLVPFNKESLPAERPLRQEKHYRKIRKSNFNNKRPNIK